MITRQKTQSSKLRSLYLGHRKIARACLAELLASPIATGITSLVIAFALLFPALLYLVSLNISASLGDINAQARASVYLDVGLNEAEAREVSDRLQISYGLNTVVQVPPEQALEEFSENADLGDLLSSLPINPLPYTLLLTLDSNALGGVEALMSDIASEPGVESVQFDLLWLQRVQGIAGVVSRLGLVLLLVVLAGLVAIVGNTIKLAVAQRQQEIRVIKLIGGSSSFIARPFLYRGTFLGLSGALLACLLLSGLLWTISGPVQSLSQLYSGEFELATPTPFEYLSLLLLGTGTGWVAAFLSSWRNIAAIEP